MLQAKASRFEHYTAADLAHLLTFFTHPTADFIHDDSALVVIDGVSMAFDAAYSRVHDQQTKKQTDSAKWSTSRKYAVMGDLVSRLQKLATVHNAVVLMTQQTRMRIRSGAGALLLPVLSGVEWDSSISTQLVLFRDFPPKTTTLPRQELLDRWNRLRYVGVIKVNGVSAEENGRFDTVVPFSIEQVMISFLVRTLADIVQNGLCELPPLQPDVAAPVISSPARASKRRFEEIADSEGENGLESDDDYGFDEDIDFESGLGEVTAAS